ncbi:MAG TPA: hypothetical protein VFI22_09820, partial [Thermomicrobiales bacterium]|nr:hypothetical protein [Thermomicrobiales bacterium]
SSPSSQAVEKSLLHHRPAALDILDGPIDRFRRGQIGIKCLGGRDAELVVQVVVRRMRSM